MPQSEWPELGAGTSHPPTHLPSHSIQLLITTASFSSTHPPTFSTTHPPTHLPGQDGVIACATEKDANVVVTGIVGCAGLLPTVEAIKARKTIALANKETLISGGPAIVPLLKEYGVDVIPADSEHSAIFQSLQGVPPGGLRKIILTASGGAFRDWSVDDLKKVGVSLFYLYTHM